MQRTITLPLLALLVLTACNAPERDIDADDRAASVEALTKPLENAEAMEERALERKREADAALERMERGDGTPP